MSAARGEDCGRSMMIGGSRRHAKTAPAGGSAEAVNLVGRFTPWIGGRLGVWGARNDPGLPTPNSTARNAVELGTKNGPGLRRSTGAN